MLKRRLNLVLSAGLAARRTYKPLLDRYAEVVTTTPELTARLLLTLLGSVPLSGVVFFAEDANRATIDLTKQVDKQGLPYLLVLEKCHSASVLFELASREFVLISQDRIQVESTIERFIGHLTKPDRGYRNDMGQVSRIPGDIWVRQGYGHRRVSLEEIRSISADKDYAIIELPTTSLLVRTTLSELEEKLDARDFIRIHRSHIVPAQRIRELRNATRYRHQVQLDDGTVFPVGKTYWPRLRGHLRKWTIR
ncbi:LytR/AlgR family response regulator transcription factor [Hyphobacterium sp.]|jgi:hypothetical protein|uniref:LytR/AlgR family response regulator transcription factor n=1 Tax=Hyphobacterium sp. TaxID=2004662 RepID=UPI003BAB697E